MLMPFKKIIVERIYFDGFGSQYLTAMASIAYCDHMRYRYFHNPFTMPILPTVSIAGRIKPGPMASGLMLQLLLLALKN